MLRFRRVFAVNLIAVFLIMVSFSGVCFASMSESEPNNSAETATVIPSDYDLAQEITASIGSAGDVDYYEFTPLNSGGYAIETLGSTDTYGYLYDNNMQLLDVCDDQVYPGGVSFELRYLLTAYKTYYIKVTHKDTVSGTGDYGLKITQVNLLNDETEPNDSFETAMSLPNYGFNDQTTAEIGVAGDEDYFRFVPGYSGSFTIETLGATDTYGYLYDSSHNILVSDDDSGESVNFKISYNLTGYQAYYIRVRDFYSDRTGSYSIKITPPSGVLGSDYDGDDFNSATQLTGNIVSFQGSAINYPGDIDLFEFSPTEDGIYTFQSTGYFDEYGEVYDSSYTLIGSDDNNGDGGNFRIEVPLTASQTYYLKVIDANGGTGSYGIDIAREKSLPIVQYAQQPYDNLCWATATSMVISYFLGDNINRTADIAQSRAQTVYDGTPTETQYGPYYYTYPSVFNQPAFLVNCDNFIRLYVDPDPNIDSHENISADPRDTTTYNYSFSEFLKSIDNNYPILAKVPNVNGGAHVIVIKGYKETDNGMEVIYNDPLDGQEHMVNYDDVGTIGYTTFFPYNIDLEPNNTTEDATILTDNDQPVQASIGKPGDIDYYRFGASPNTQYVIETSGAIDTYGELYDSDGNLIESTDSGGQGGNFRIARYLIPYRQYYIKVYHSSSSGMGDYTLNLSHTY